MPQILPPRLVVAASASGRGKTTVAIGLMAALRARGLRVAPSKVGPDYIDPGYHAVATGQPGRNLDPHLCGTAMVAPLFAHGSRGADVAVVEGVMGLFDGRLGTPPVGRKGFGSTAHVAGLVQAPVLLVLDAARSSRTLAAEALGMARFDDTHVAGVVLNRSSSPRNIDECRRALADVGLPLLGALPTDPELATPSRHLGLVPAAERHQARDMVARAGALVARHLDLDAVLDLAGRAPRLAVEPWTPGSVVTPVAGRPRVAMAGGQAFTFRYPETAELLQAAGCEPVDFDPLHDEELPERTAALYLGGGFPQVHAGALAANRRLRDQVRNLVAAGLPTVAECAGLLYLCRSVDDQPMSGALPLEARMSPRLTLGYRELEVADDTLLFRTGETVSSHEFHRTRVDPVDRPDAAAGALAHAWRVDGRPDGVSLDPAGTGRPTVHASYQHVHWAGHPQAAQRLAEAASRWMQDRGTAPATTAGAPATSVAAPAASPVTPASTPGTITGTPWTSSATPEVGDATATREPDLTHHGDADLADGLVDLAVNVRRGAPPDWLAQRIARPERWGAYPGARAVQAAREALGRHHGVDPAMVLPTAGAAEAFGLVARALPWRRPLVVHPQFTEPEHALRQAGQRPRRLLLGAPGFQLDPAAVDPRPDLVVVGNPTNPTGVLHPASALRAVQRPGRVLLVDEAFMDAVPGEPESMVQQEMPGLLVTRSLTKTWGLAGIRAGYVVGDPALVDRLAALQPPWSVSTPALDAMVAVATPQARAMVEQDLVLLDSQRRLLADELARIGLPPVPGSRAPFLLVDAARLGPNPREALGHKGFAVRRGDSFPGLGSHWIRLAVRDRATTHRLVEAIEELLEGRP